MHQIARHARIAILVLLVVALAVLIQSLRLNSQQQQANGEPTMTQKEEVGTTVLAAGDIAGCSYDADEATAQILDRYPNAPILTLGDNAYESGKITEFMNCFEPTWGRHKDRIYPSIGNHEYGTPGGDDYFTYFKREKPAYYSFELANWHFIALDSNCTITLCTTESEQVRWLTADLHKLPADKCVIAYMHHPRFSSGKHGNDDRLITIWQTLYDGGVDLVLAGHDHTYERIAPLSPDGYVNNTRGMRSLVVGTGGRGLYEFDEIVYGSEKRNNTVHGVLKLELFDGRYDYSFIPVAGQEFSDFGSGLCLNTGKDT